MDEGPSQGSTVAHRQMPRGALALQRAAPVPAFERSPGRTHPLSAQDCWPSCGCRAGVRGCPCGTAGEVIGRCWVGPRRSSAMIDE